MQSLQSFFKRLHPALFFVLAFALFLPPIASGAQKKEFVVVIDPGHGGSDVGALENDVMEKSVNLAVALKLGEMIKKKLKDTKVIYTRSTDEFISLQKRADIANKAKADLFVSIHCNSVDRSNKNRANVLGATTYVLGHHKDADNLAVAKRENAVVELDADDSAHYSEFDPSSDESYIIFEMTQKKNFQNSIRFASDVQKEMASAGRYSRGVQQAGFWVLWSTAMPAALIELDFLCNPEQAKFLNSKNGQEKLAGAIFNAIKNYEAYYRKSLGMASVSSDSPSTVTALLAEEIVENSEEQPNVDMPAATELAELAYTETKPRRQTRSSSQSSSKTSSSGSGTHRRRSASSRSKGAADVEETVIHLPSEENPGVTVMEIASSATDSDKKKSKDSRKSEAKKSSKVKDNVKTDTSKPARRNKEAKKRRLRQSVNVGYKVLLFESDEELLANDEVFHGLTPVSTFRENNTYKYTYGESSERKEMEALLDEIADLFPDARVIKFYF